MKPQLTHAERLAQIPERFHDPVQCWESMKRLTALVHRYQAHGRRAYSANTKHDSGEVASELGKMLKGIGLIEDSPINAPRIYAKRQSVYIPDPEPEPHPMMRE